MYTRKYAKLIFFIVPLYYERNKNNFTTIQEMGEYILYLMSYYRDIQISVFYIND